MATGVAGGRAGAAVAADVVADAAADAPAFLETMLAGVRDQRWGPVDIRGRRRRRVPDQQPQPRSSSSQTQPRTGMVAAAAAATAAAAAAATKTATTATRRQQQRPHSPRYRQVRKWRSGRPLRPDSGAQPPAPPRLASARARPPARGGTGGGRVPGGCGGPKSPTVTGQWHAYERNRVGQSPKLGGGPDPCTVGVTYACARARARAPARGVSTYSCEQKGGHETWTRV